MRTLDEITRIALIRMGESGEQKYPRVLQLAIGGLRELNMDTKVGNVKWRKLELLPNDTALLPDDYIDFVKIATCDAGGNFYALSLNKKMCAPRQLKCFQEEVSTIETITETRPKPWGKIDEEFGAIAETWGSYNPTEEVETPINRTVKKSTVKYEGKLARVRTEGTVLGGTNHFDGSSFIGAVFNNSSGYNVNGTYKINRAEGYVALNNFHGASVFMEYLADPSSIDGNYYVHQYIEEALLAWIQYQMASHNLNFAIGEKMRLKREWVIEKKKSRLRLNSYTIREWVDMINSGFSLGPKFWTN